MIGTRNPIVGFDFPLPAGVRVVELRTLQTNMSAKGDTYTEQLTLSVCGQTVYVCRYNRNDAETVVRVGGGAGRVMHMRNVGAWLAELAR